MLQFQVQDILPAFASEKINVVREAVSTSATGAGAWFLDKLCFQALLSQIRYAKLPLISSSNPCHLRYTLRHFPWVFSLITISVRITKMLVLYRSSLLDVDLLFKFLVS